MSDIHILIDCIGRGGAEKIVVTLANELARQGHSVTLLLLRRNIGYELNEKVKLLTMSDKPFPKGWLHSVGELLRGLWWTRRTLEASGTKHTFLLSNLTRSNLINIALAVVMPHHRAFCVSHASVDYYRKRGIGRTFLLMAEGLFFPLAYRTICVSKRMTADYQRLWKFRKNSVITIYNPVHTGTSLASSGGSVSQKPTTVHIGMVARLHPVKRHDLALRAMRILKESRPGHYVLHIMGEGPQEQAIRSMVAELNLGDRVVMHGWTDEPGEILRGCAMTLLCSDTEGFPNSVVESLASGIPVVATDCVSGPRELLAPHLDVEQEIEFQEGFLPTAHGVLVRVGDPEALARGIEYQACRSSLERNTECIAFAKQFEPARIAREYTDLLAGP
ncbi:glycosyltransferase [Ramlibacter sp. AN1133]|uniref:glycosyltransferase n=1 Tax=Ramlibacter sp. AN1133 TaxID=3133429 RepID=UPI0030C249E7